MPRYDTGLYQDTMGRLSDYVKQKLSPDVVEQITSDVDRNIFGGKVTLPKIVRFGQSLMNKTKGAFENYANRQSDIQQQLSQAYQTGQVSPQLSSELMGNFPMGAEVKGLYHGSPYKFNKFAQEKIGTGEGAQAFGYGHYLTESPEIAQKYATDLYNKVDRKLQLDTQAAKDYLKKQNYRQEIIDEIPNEPMNWQQLHHNLTGRGIETDDLWNALEKASYKRAEIDQHLYQTTVNKGKPSSADVFLEWDKPVNNEAIQRLIKYFSESSNPKLMSMVPRIKYFGDKGFTDASGEKLYNEIVTDLGGNKEAQRRVSDLMNRAGITGIKYPSGTKSGIKDSPYYNYVIFNPEDITIEAVK
jgi:hypothetical protein